MSRSVWYTVRGTKFLAIVKCMCLFYKNSIIFYALVVNRQQNFVEIPPSHLCRSNLSILKLKWYAIAWMHYNLFNHYPMMSKHFLPTLLPYKQCCNRCLFPYIFTSSAFICMERFQKCEFCFEKYVFLTDTAKLLSQKTITIRISISNHYFCYF